MRVKVAEDECPTCGRPRELWLRETTPVGGTLYPRTSDMATAVHKFKVQPWCDRYAQAWTW